MKIFVCVLATIAIARGGFLGGLGRGNGGSNGGGTVDTYGSDQVISGGSYDDSHRGANDETIVLSIISEAGDDGHDGVAGGHNSGPEGHDSGAGNDIQVIKIISQESGAGGNVGGANGWAAGRSRSW